MFTRRAKDIQRCLRSIESFTDNQARVVDCDYDRLKSISIEITPKEGPYKDGRFLFEIDMPLKYPQEPPDVTCKTFVYHPNIDPTCSELNVCLSLFDEWEAHFGLEDIIQGLLFLFYEPNLEDPLSPYFSGESYDTFEEDVAKSMRGEDIDGVSFDVVIDIPEEKKGDIEITMSPCDTGTTKTVESNDTSAITCDASAVTEAGTLSDALDVVDTVMELVNKVATDSPADIDVVNNAKNVIQTTQEKESVTEDKSEPTNADTDCDNSAESTNENSADTVCSCPNESETVVGLAACNVDREDTCDTKDTVSTEDNSVESCSEKEEKEETSAESKAAESETETTPTMNGDTTDPGDTTSQSNPHPSTSAEDKTEPSKKPLPVIEFDNVETILKKVEDLLVTKAEEVDKLEEIEAKKDDDEENSADEEEEEDEDEEEEEKEADAEDQVKDETPPNPASTTDSDTSLSSLTAESSASDTSVSCGSTDSSRVVALTRQSSKIEKYDFIFERVVRENKSTQTDFSLFMNSYFGLQYIAPVDFVNRYLDPFVEFPISICTGILLNYFENYTFDS